jgi:hypothetical protein
MFSWYKSATVCFAYLDDYTPNPLLNPGSDAFRSKLGACRWFSRGWTLQELIAPFEIWFYDSHWSKFETKEELIGDLSAITRIDEVFLRNTDLLSEAPVGKKMFWAANRKTTRVEDIAYCLLGIFNINMPLLYGEGRRAYCASRKKSLAAKTT